MLEEEADEKKFSPREGSLYISLDVFEPFLRTQVGGTLHLTVQLVKKLLSMGVKYQAKEDVGKILL